MKHKRQADSQIHIQTLTHTYRLTNTHTDSQTHTSTHKHTYRLTNTHTDSQTHTPTHKHTYLEEALDPRGIEVACENAVLIRPSNRLLSSSLNSRLRACV